MHTRFVPCHCTTLKCAISQLHSPLKIRRWVDIITKNLKNLDTIVE